MSRRTLSPENEMRAAPTFLILSQSREQAPSLALKKARDIFFETSLRLGREPSTGNLGK